jgi:hypothetical protein
MVKVYSVLADDFYSSSNYSFNFLVKIFTNITAVVTEEVRSILEMKKR